MQASARKFLIDPGGDHMDSCLKCLFWGVAFSDQWDVRKGLRICSLFCCISCSSNDYMSQWVLLALAGLQWPLCVRLWGISCLCCLEWLEGRRSIPIYSRRGNIFRLPVLGIGSSCLVISRVGSWCCHCISFFDTKLQSHSQPLQALSCSEYVIWHFLRVHL